MKRIPMAFCSLQLITELAQNPHLYKRKERSWTDEVRRKNNGWMLEINWKGREFTMRREREAATKKQAALLKPTHTSSNSQTQSCEANKWPIDRRTIRAGTRTLRHASSLRCHDNSGTAAACQSGERRTEEERSLWQTTQPFRQTRRFKQQHFFFIFMIH